MTNKNCLEGYACPKCKQDTCLKISGTALFTVHDDGTEDHSDVEWEYHSFTLCPVCGFDGILGDFEVKDV